jgi:hypothetical protein
VISGGVPDRLRSIGLDPDLYSVADIAHDLRDQTPDGCRASDSMLRRIAAFNLKESS